MDYDRDISISAKFMKDKDLIPKKVEKIKPEENINHPFLPKIEGELIVLPYDLGLLRNLDLLEGFSENDKFYHRVLIPVTARAVGKDNNKISEKESLEVAWTYIMRNISKNSGMRPFNKNVWRP
jgi:hypothetical protein